MRNLVSIKPITYIKPILGADMIECAIVDHGWPVVVRKGEFKVDDLGLYFEIDSWVPSNVAPFLSVDGRVRQYNGVQGERLKTVRKKGQVSQGLLLPLSSNILEMLGVPSNLPVAETAFQVACLLGKDLSEILDVQKWEPPIPANLAGTMKGNFPHFISKTDQERCQNLYEDIFVKHANETYEVSVKLDGSSMTVYVRDEDSGVCSRRINLKETDDNTFWIVSRQQGLLSGLLEFQRETGRNLALQGELIGEKIQGNPEGVKGQRFYLFDIYDIDAGTYLTPAERAQVCNKLNEGGQCDIPMVPIVEPSLKVADSFPSIDSILDYAEGKSLFAQQREGLVFKSNDSSFTFKAIANSYLLKNKDR